MHSSFCGAHCLNKLATTLCMTGVSAGSIKPSLQMDLNYIVINEGGNAVGPVRVENVVLPETSNYNLFSLSKLLNSGWKMQDDASNVVMSRQCYKHYKRRTVLRALKKKRSGYCRR